MRETERERVRETSIHCSTYLWIHQLLLVCALARVKPTILEYLNDATCPGLILDSCVLLILVASKAGIGMLLLSFPRPQSPGSISLDPPPPTDTPEQRFLMYSLWTLGRWTRHFGVSPCLHTLCSYTSSGPHWKIEHAKERGCVPQYKMPQFFVSPQGGTSAC